MTDPEELEVDIEAATDDIGLDLFSDEPQVELPEVKEPVAEPITEPAAEANSAEVTALGAPDTWTKEAITDWATIPDRAKQEILKREQDMIQGIEGYKGRAQLGDTYTKILEPHMAAIQQFGVDPAQMLAGFANSHATFTFGTPAEKQQLAQHLLRSYNIDPVELALSMQPGAAPTIDPNVAALTEKLNDVTGRLTAREQREHQATFDRELSAVVAFGSDPTNIYYKEVENDIVGLLNSGVAKTLPQAYEMAVWNNPATRAKEIARTLAPVSPTASAADPRTSALAANVDPRPQPGNGAVPVGSMEDTLREAYEAATSRH